MENENFENDSEQCIKVIVIASEDSESSVHEFNAIEPDLTSESDSSVVWFRHLLMKKTVRIMKS